MLKYFESNFDHFMHRVDDALGPVFDAWEAKLGGPLDRGAISEMMVRYALSETLVPTPPGQTPLPMSLHAMVQALLGGKAG